MPVTKKTICMPDNLERSAEFVILPMVGRNRPNSTIISPASSWRVNILRLRALPVTLTSYIRAYPRIVFPVIQRTINITVNSVPTVERVIHLRAGTGPLTIRNSPSVSKVNTPRLPAKAAIKMVFLQTRLQIVFPAMQKTIPMRDNLAVNAGPAIPPKVGVRPALIIIRWRFPSRPILSGQTARPLPAGIVM